MRTRCAIQDTNNEYAEVGDQEHQQQGSDKCEATHPPIGNLTETYVKPNNIIW